MENDTRPLLDENAVLSILAKQVAEARSQARWCMENQVSTVYLNDVLNGRREPGKKILDVLGLETVTVYRSKTGNA